MATTNIRVNDELFSVLGYSLWWARYIANHTIKQRRRVRENHDKITSGLVDNGWRVYLYNGAGGNGYWFIIAPKYTKELFSKETTLHNLKYGQDYLSLKHDLHNYLLEVRC